MTSAAREAHAARAATAPAFPAAAFIASATAAAVAAAEAEGRPPFATPPPSTSAKGRLRAENDAVVVAKDDNGFPPPSASLPPWGSVEKAKTASATEEGLEAACVGTSEESWAPERRRRRARAER